jgi:hypothetical protein
MATAVSATGGRPCGTVIQLLHVTGSRQKRRGGQRDLFGLRWPDRISSLLRLSAAASSNRRTRAFRADCSMQKQPSAF